MSLKSFWMNVRSAARDVLPHSSPDTVLLEDADILRGLRSSETWLTLKAVAGYDEADFAFLPASERTELSDSVRAFRSAVENVRRAPTASTDDRGRALASFARILGILRIDRYFDAEALVVGREIERHIAGRLPPEVTELRFETGQDVGGQPGVWIWATVNDDAVGGREDFFRVAQAVGKLLFETVQEHEIKYWPYAHFRLVSELVPIPVRATR